MAYHRKMMHSFLISNYLAKEIINLKNITKWIPLKRKIKRALINYLVKEQTDFSVPNSFADSIKMLLVNGSSQYKLWLKRAIALDDVQTYLKRVNKFTQGSAKQFRSLPDIIEPYTPAEEEYDYGDITGYAYEGIELPSNNNIPEPTPGIYSKFILKDNIGLDVNKNSKNGYGNLYRDSSSHYEENSERLNIVTDLSKQKREINFKDITDIALTTLAYLSFGMFTLQVLMCIVMTKEDERNVMMLPFEVTESTDPIDEIEEIRRRKRSIEQNHSFAKIIDLSKFILISVEHISSLGRSSTISNETNIFCNLFSKLKLSLYQKSWISLAMFQNTSLWVKLITSATGMFSTQEGYDMAKTFYDKHNGQFGSAQHLIERSLRNIKEEVRWSEQNLPVIEQWIDNFLTHTQKTNA
ncbi:uncharacterized protein [Drosophila takahashii]